MSSPLWVDGAAYCRNRLLGGAAVPWTDPGQLASFLSRSVALTGTDAVLVDVGQAWQVRAGDPSLMEAMARQTRRARPLRALLGDERGLALVGEAVRAAVAACTVPVIAVLPSPARWAQQTAVSAGLPDTPPDQDTADAAAMYVAGALQALGDLGVAGYLLHEGDGPARELPHPGSYEPVANVAAHLRVPVVVRTDGAPCWPHGPLPGVQVWLGATPPDGVGRPWGLVEELGAAPPASSGGAPGLVRIPPAADPDDVAAVLRSWGRRADGS